MCLLPHQWIWLRQTAAVQHQQPVESYRAASGARVCPIASLSDLDRSVSSHISESTWPSSTSPSTTRPRRSAAGRSVGRQLAVRTRCSSWSTTTTTTLRTGPSSAVDAGDCRPSTSPRPTVYTFCSMPRPLGRPSSLSTTKVFDFVEISEDLIRTRGNKFKLVQHHCHYYLRKLNFTVCVIITFAKEDM